MGRVHPIALRFKKALPPTQQQHRSIVNMAVQSAISPRNDVVPAGNQCQSARAATGSNGPLHGLDAEPTHPCIDRGRFNRISPVREGAVSTGCNACPFCEDTCEDPFCRRCASKRERERQNVVSGEARSQPTDGGFFGFRPFEGCSRPSGEKYYTRCQLKRHNNASSAWLLAGDTIYDATAYVMRHPGGSMSILKKSGGSHDCSEDMQFHSNRAVKVWKQKRVGKLRRCPGEGEQDGVVKRRPEEEQCTIC